MASTEHKPSPRVTIESIDTDSPAAAMMASESHPSPAMTIGSTGSETSFNMLSHNDSITPNSTGPTSPSLPPQADKALTEPTNGKMPSSGVIHNKLLDQVMHGPGRLPSPQPTHLGVPGTPGHLRFLDEEGPGYVAPKFEGKEQQMEQGTYITVRL